VLEATQRLLSNKKDRLRTENLAVVTQLAGALGHKIKGLISVMTGVWEAAFQGKMAIWWCVFY
jgi:hypothetical protein